MKKVICLFTLIILSSKVVAQEGVVTPTIVDKVAMKRHYQQRMPLLLETESFSLSADSGSLIHDLSLQLTKLHDNQLALMPSDMVNVTGEFAEGYRLLPNGEHFSTPAVITLPYDPYRIPMGYRPTDIYTFYYDEDIAQWKQLERVSVDTIRHAVISYTTHFTDFVDAIIRMPEIPENKTYVPTFLQDLPKVDVMQGIPMVTVPHANNMGTAELTYPIVLPNGRKGLQPDMSLHYSSSSGNGILGVGWSLFIPSISIDTRWGVPRFDPMRETESYLVNGDPVVLHDKDGWAIPLPHQASQFETRMTESVRFYPRDTKNTNRVIRHGSSPDSYWWSVTDCNGVTTYYGRIFNPEHPEVCVIDTNSVIVSTNNFIAYWAATATVDTYGNYIIYDNFKQDNNIYISTIRYTGNIHEHIVPSYRIHLLYHERTDSTSTARLGVLQENKTLLCHILVQYLKGGILSPDSIENLSAYFMHYSIPNERSLYKSRLDYIDCIDSTSYHDLDNRCAIDEHVGILKNTTRFSYSDAPVSADLFGLTQDVDNIENSQISRNLSRSWSVGGTATVGFGPDVVTTLLSGGGNYSYNRGTGHAVAMLIDLNGDGLVDLVREDFVRHKVLYKKQIITNNGLEFAPEEEVVGLTRLSHDVSETHTWGLQLSCIANISYSRPHTTTYTDAYFADVNGDGLPDMIDNDHVYINHLVNDNPVFSEYDGNPNHGISVRGSSCGHITMNGEVDPNLECIPTSYTYHEKRLSSWYENSETEYPYTAEVVGDNDADYSALWNESYISNESEKWVDDASNLTISNGYILGQRNIYQCPDYYKDPVVDNVRVWVAPRNGPVHIDSEMSWIADSTQSFVKSNTKDGVVCQILHYHGVSADSTHLHANTCTPLKNESFSRLDTARTMSTSAYVSRGDVLFFRLRSGDNNLYDRINWNHTILYCDNSETYNSQEDYICTGDKYFRAAQSGQVEYRIQARNDRSGFALIRLVLSSDTTPPSTHRIFLLSHSSPIDTTIYLTVQKGQNLHLIVDTTSYLSRPVWSDVHIIPTVKFISSFYDKDSIPVTDTIYYTPDVEISYSYDKQLPPVYRSLFGPLYRYWGQFAYLDHGDEFVLLDSLRNTLVQAGESADRLEDLTITFDQDSDWSNQLSTIWAENNIFNPLDTSHYWLNMTANSATECWNTYGNLGCIGKNIHSNAREYNVSQEQIDDYVIYDSSIPHVSQAGDISSRNHTIRKRTLSTQNSVSWGAMGIINDNVTMGDYDIVTDYMDMNGDGFPDFVGPGGVQYSTPWGGIGTYVPVNNFIAYRNHSFAQNRSFSASSGMFRKKTGNTRDGKFFLEGAAGISGGIATTNTMYGFVDVNGDGLVDMVDKAHSMVCYNLGYSFSSPKECSNVIVNSSSNINESADFSILPESDNVYDLINKSLNQIQNLPKNHSIFQVSISGGAGVGSTENQVESHMLDINGDGLPDLVQVGNFGYTTVRYNLGGRFAQAVELPLTYTSKDLSYNISTNLGATGGFTFLGTIKFNIGLQSSPWGLSISNGQVAMLDMNGDGLVDHVTYDAMHHAIQVRYNKAGGANLLTKVTNPTGQKISLQYALTDATTTHSRQWVLTEIHDSVPGHPNSMAEASIQKISYKNPQYDHFERTDYGFSSVQTVWDNEKVYVEQYENQSYLQRGQKTTDTIMDIQRHPYISHHYITTYQSQNQLPKDNCNDADLYIQTATTGTDYFEGNTSPLITTSYELQYDNHHNIIRRLDYGDDAIGDDDYKQYITYLSNTANNMVSLPVSEVIIQQGDTLRHTRAYYNSNGSVSSIVHENNGQTATTDIQYNTFGLPQQFTKPENSVGQRSWIHCDYDSVCYTYPTHLSDQFGLNSSMVYDYRWGCPIRTIDPAGAMIEYRYDNIGRLKSVRTPRERAVGAPYSIQYTYHNTLNGINDPNQLYVVQQMYDAGAIIKEITNYDARGQILQSRYYRNGDWFNSVSNEYDMYGRVIRSIYPFRHEYDSTKYDYEAPGMFPEEYIKYDLLDRPVEYTHYDASSARIKYGIKKDSTNQYRLCTTFMDENDVVTQEYKSPQGWLVQRMAGDSSITSFTYNAIGELLLVQDADHVQTKYSYDKLGRVLSRTRSDFLYIGWQYDPIGNVITKQTENLQKKGVLVQYYYNFDRLDSIVYPNYLEDKVVLTYDNAGRIQERQDGTGTERFSYDWAGNVTTSDRTIRIPEASSQITLHTEYDYDSFGRLRNLLYPDGELVTYHYRDNGLLSSVTGVKGTSIRNYIQSIDYDEAGRKIYQKYGNNVENDFVYDSSRQWLNRIQTSTPSKTLQSLEYTHDATGQITEVNQTASDVSGMGGIYRNTYTYDNQYRLIESHGSGFSYDLSCRFSPAGKLGEKSLSSYAGSESLYYGYDARDFNHKVQTVFDGISGETMALSWDLDGNLVKMENCEGKTRLHEWDDEDRLRFFLDSKAGYYGYDGNGERIYKLIGSTETYQINASKQLMTVYFDKYTLYPNPYITLTHAGYTKNYFVGSERICSTIGGGFEQSNDTLCSSVPRLEEMKLSHAFIQRYTRRDFSANADVGSGHIVSIDGSGNKMLEYPCSRGKESYEMDASISSDLLSCAWNKPSNASQDEAVYYYHSDHLGSASWITNSMGHPVQYLYYAPYGEPLKNQRLRSSFYHERYTFTGKELDSESGYYYFGARFLCSNLGVWLSVDPWADKYPWISPYAYCAWNPITNIDPIGCGDPLTTMIVRRMKVSNTFGMVRHYSDGHLKPHQGIDYYAPVGTNVMAIKDGIIVGCDYEGKGDYGKTITLQFETDDGKTAWAFYSHLSDISVSVNDVVKEGDFVGKTGISGNAKDMKGEDQHLHFEYRTGGAVLGKGLLGRDDPNLIVDTKFEIDPSDKNKVKEVDVQ